MEGRWKAYLEWLTARGRANRSTCQGLRPGALDLPETHVPLELERLARLTSDLKGVLETAREQDPL